MSPIIAHSSWTASNAKLSVEPSEGVEVENSSLLVGEEDKRPRMEVTRRSKIQRLFHVRDLGGQRLGYMVGRNEN